MTNTDTTAMTPQEVLRKQLSLKLTLPKRAVLGNEIPLVVAMKNQADVSVTISVQYEAKELSMHIYDDIGYPSARTEFGKRVLGDFSGLQVVSASLHRIKPGETYQWTKDLNKCFSLPLGRCRVDVFVPVSVEQPPEGVGVMLIGSAEFQVDAPKEFPPRR